MSSQLCQLPDISPPVGVHTRALSVHSTGELLRLVSVQGERTGQAWRKKQLLQLSWPSPSSSQCSCEPEPKKPSKSTQDSRCSEIIRWSVWSANTKILRRRWWSEVKVPPPYFSTDLVFDLGQVPCLLCQHFPSCPQEQNPYLIWCVKVSAFRSFRN